MKFQEVYRRSEAKIMNVRFVVKEVGGGINKEIKEIFGTQPEIW